MKNLTSNHYNELHKILESVISVNGENQEQLKAYMVFLRMLPYNLSSSLKDIDDSEEKNSLNTFCNLLITTCNDTCPEACKILEADNITFPTIYENFLISKNFSSLELRIIYLLCILSLLTHFCSSVSMELVIQKGDTINALFSDSSETIFEFLNCCAVCTVATLEQITQFLEPAFFNSLPNFNKFQLLLQLNRFLVFHFYSIES